MATVAGNLFELKQCSGLRLLDIRLPAAFAAAYPGPAYGVEGTRRLAAVHGRPLIGTIIKPSVGLGPDETAALVRVLADAGIDFIKDDELQSDGPACPFEARARAVMRAVNDNAERTGKKVMVAFNLTGDLDQMRRRHDLVQTLGGTCVMASLNSVGLVGMIELRRHAGLPIHAHRNGWGYLSRHPLLGWSYVAWHKIWRLAGVDHMHVNGLRNKFSESDESVITSARACLAPLFARQAMRGHAGVLLRPDAGASPRHLAGAPFHRSDLRGGRRDHGASERPGGWRDGASRRVGGGNRRRARRGPGVPRSRTCLVTPDPTPLPHGILLAWYGDDFTGSAAVMEVLTFAGLDAVLFFDVPTNSQLARFPQARAIGIAGIARAESPAWMERELPPIFRALAQLAAPVTRYKICSTFDSAPEIGSIGKAIELGLPILGRGWVPLVTAAPAIHRYQAFGNLFAMVAGEPFRLDRHPTMSRHPVTPMNEADLRVHLAHQTSLPVGLVDLVAMKSGRAEEQLAAERARGARIISLDVVDAETLAIAGRLIWEGRDGPLFAVGSQGVEYALIAYWRAVGLIPAEERGPRAAAVERMVVASGSCSPVTAGQIAWAEAHGFAPVAVDAARAVDEDAWAGELARATAAALGALSAGRDPILYTARGADDPAVAGLRDAVRSAGADESVVNARIGTGLGHAVDRIVRTARINRAVIAGGDTASRGARALDVFALTALAATVPGAALFKAHSEDAALANLELALKGGQMGSVDYFGLIKAGGVG